MKQTSAMSDEEIERQYNPAVAVPDFALHLKAWRIAATHAYQTLAYVKDIRYGSGARQLLDIFPSANGPASTLSPVCLFFHGGAWRSLSKEFVAGIAGSLVPAGITCVCVGYDLCPQVPLARIAEEAREACAWVVSNIASYGGDPRAIVLAGSSAGAQLAALMLSDRYGPALGEDALFPIAAALASGLYDLRPLTRVSFNVDLGLDSNSAANLSPLFNLPRRRAPMLVAVGSDETSEWIGQSRQYHLACLKSGVPAELFLVPGANHFTVGIGVPGTEMNTALVHFIKEAVRSVAI